MPQQRTLTTFGEQDRETIVFGRPIAWGEETRGQFVRIGPHSETGTEYLTLDQVETLIEEGYLDPDGRQNNSPTVFEFYEWGRQHEHSFDITVRLTGYMVGPERTDTRITLTAIEVVGEPTIDDRVVSHFGSEFDDADALQLSDEHLIAWWD